MLSTVALVKAEPGSGINNNYSDSTIEEYIADLSQYWLQLCGVYTLSTEYTVTETYNGTGTVRLKTRQQPILSVAAVTVNGCPIPAVSGPMGSGYGIEDNGNFIYLRGYVFWRGVQNVQITYTAGASSVPGDIQRAFTRHVALELKRKDSINIVSDSLAGGGNATFMNDKELPIDILRVMRLHSRLGM
jgi:hypothetical protein